MSGGLARKLIGVIVGLAILIPLVLLVFVAPASRATPHDLPIGVAGTAAGIEQVRSAIDEHQPGPFDVRGFDSLEALTTATADREVYGGVVVGAPQTTVIATGGSQAVATLLTSLGQEIAGAGGPPEVIDVAPPTADDPRGSGFGSIVMPVFMAGAALGIALTQFARRAWLIAVLLPVGAATVGATVIGAALAVGVIDGGFWGPWLAMACGIWAISAAVAGLVALIGLAGMGVAALVFMIVGMPLAGLSYPKEYLPWVWGDLGQWLPLGATGTTVRSTAFFDGGPIGPGAGQAFGAIALWIVVGYLLLGGSVLKRRRLTTAVLEGGTAAA